MALQKRKLPTKPTPNTIVEPESTSATIRYHENTNYREAVKALNRDSYREKNDLRPSFSFKESNAILDKLVEKKQVALLNKNLKIVLLPVATLAQCAIVFGVDSSTIFRWVNNGMLPPPVLFTKKKSGGAYLDAEVRIFIEVIGKHLTEYLRYRESNKDVTRELHVRINQLRQKQNI